MESSKPQIVSADEWQEARSELLVAEKEVTHAIDAVAARRRRLPMTAFAPDWTLPFVSSRGTTFADDCGAGGGFLLSVFLRDGEDVYRTYSTTSRGIDRLTFTTSVLDLTVFGRREEWEDSPAGRPQQPTAIFPNTMPLESESVSFGRFG
jgi:predicted dithiol-disulfide oxidoreductase (DUF899 family)